MLGQFLGFVLFELMLPVLAGLPVEFGSRSLTAAFGHEKDAPAVLAWIGLLLIGAALGGISLGIWRYRLAGAGPFAGVSLIVSPLLNGLVMDTYGRWRRRHGRPATHASTFWGGAIFALGIALVRVAFAGFPTLPVER